MILRKLEKEEHRKTRKLWEQVFAEDTKEFLDYYYTVKTVENEIYVIEEDGDIRAMLHLNPYSVRIGEAIVLTHYIVAVATEESYRKRGYMAKLLKRAMEDMRRNGEVFTFLMPAAEAIYYPHGFRFIYRQKQGHIAGRKRDTPEISISVAETEDCGDMADFADRILKEKYEVYVKRNKCYYERLLREFESENGGLLLVKEEGKLVGLLAYGEEGEYEIVEPLFESGKESLIQNAVYVLTRDETTEVHLAGCMENGTEKPIIMAKILNIPKMLEQMKAEEELELLLTVLDAPEGNELGTFYISGKEELRIVEIQSCGEEGLRAASVECLPEQITIGDLTSVLFGYLYAEDMNLTEHLKKELKKIRPLNRIFFNEIV